MAASASAAEGAATMGIKRKPELFEELDDDHHQSLFIYNMTMSKLVTSSPTRQKPVEPSLQRSVLIRNTLRRLEASISMASPVHPPHSPRKKLQCVNWPVSRPSADSQADFQLLLNGLVISGSEDSGQCPMPAVAASEMCVAAMEVDPGGSTLLAHAPAVAEANDLAAAYLAQGHVNAVASSSALPLHALAAAPQGSQVCDARPTSSVATDMAALACIGELDRVLVPRKDSPAVFGHCGIVTGTADCGLPRSSAADNSFDEIDVNLLSELDAFCSAAAATRAASVVEELDGVGCATARDVRYDELDNILQVLVGI